MNFQIEMINEGLPKDSRVRVISLITSGDSSGYLEDWSLHLNISPEERAVNLTVLMVRVDVLDPDIVKDPCPMT